MKKLRAFTLVELLVVIGIIALLISILLPSLQSARRAAECVKCLSAMRQIGSAVQMYVSDNKGWAPPGKTWTTDYTITYDWAGATQPPAQNQFWYNFIAKYVMKGVPAGSLSTNVTPAEAEAALHSVIWGCPAWHGYQGNQSYTVDGVAWSQCGYGFNLYPEYTASWPPAANPPNCIGDDSLGPANKATLTNARGINVDHCMAQPGARQTPNVDWSQWMGAWTAPGGFNATYFGQWYKWNAYTQPADRALLADSLFWALECDAAYLNKLNNTTIYKGGMCAEGAGYNNQTWIGGGSPLPGQSQFDFYRHGKYPRVVGGAVGSTSAYFDVNGGSVRYNVLFCDGHAATLVDRAAGYKAARMRYPG